MYGKVAITYPPQKKSSEAAFSQRKMRTMARTIEFSLILILMLISTLSIYAVAPLLRNL